MIDVPEFSIATLDVRPGDVVVLKFSRHLSSDDAANVQRQIKPILPNGVKAMILDAQVELSVLTYEEIENRSVGGVDVPNNGRTLCGNDDATAKDWGLSD